MQASRAPRLPAPPGARTMRGMTASTCARTSHPSRRRFVQSLPLGGLLGATLPATSVAWAQPGGPGIGEWFPRQDPDLAQAVVGSSHFDFKRVRELVERQPALARAAIDWGFGDWETALGAAAHTGRREIAEFLLANGAQPTLFSAAMLGQLAVVRAFVEASPGIQRIPGPHAIPLLAHARAGGPGAAAVVAYLESVGGADVRPASAPLMPAARDAVVGRYTFGAGARDRFEVDVRDDQLGLERPGATRRFLIHTGGLVFFPSGVPSVRIAFVREGAAVARMTIADPDVVVTARRG